MLDVILVVTPLARSNQNIIFTTPQLAFFTSLSFALLLNLNEVIDLLIKVRVLPPIPYLSLLISTPNIGL